MKLSIEDLKKRIYDAHNGTIVLDEKTYKNTNVKCRFFDKDYGEFYAFPLNVLKGIRCRKRAAKDLSERYKLPISEVLDKIKNYNDIINLDISTYDGMGKKARFIDKEYGEWWAIPDNVYRGHLHTQRGLLKLAKALNNAGIVCHWLTNEKLVWIASFECMSAKWLNENKILFIWKPGFFVLPNNKKYFPDLALIDLSKNWLDGLKFVEIKGYFRKDAEEKWNWFHKEYPNSELWNESVLREKGIL